VSRIQTFVSNGTKKKIEAIIRQRNVDCSYSIDINLSNTTAMLIELGIKTYNQESNSIGDEFDQAKYNKLLLEHVINTSLIMQYLVSNQSLGELGIDGDDPRCISSIISSRVKETVGEIFPLTECELVDKTLRELS
jgi:hypothetical protein